MLQEWQCTQGQPQPQHSCKMLNQNKSVEIEEVRVENMDNKSDEIPPDLTAVHAKHHANNQTSPESWRPCHKKDFNRKHKTTLKAFCIRSAWPLSPSKSHFPQHWPWGQGYRCKDRVWNQVLSSHSHRVGKWRQCEWEITVLTVFCPVMVLSVWIEGGWGQSFKEILWFQYMLSFTVQTREKEQRISSAANSAYLHIEHKCSLSQTYFIFIKFPGFPSQFC